MPDIPGENSLPGSILALALVVAPGVTILLGAIQRPTVGALLRGVGASVLVIAAAVGGAYALAPGQGTVIAAAVFGGMGLVLSCLAGVVTVGGRALAAARPLTDGAPEPPDP